MQGQAVEIKRKQVARQSNLLRTRMRMSQMELLAAMADGVTLTVAARAVNLTQPAASRLLNTLEADLGIELFERDGRSLAPTTAGRKLVRKAREIIAEFDRTQRELEAISSGITGLVGVGASVSACYSLLPAAIALLHREAPDVSINIHEGSMDELVRYLREGRIDLLVGRFEDGTTLEDVHVENLHLPPAMIVCHPRHHLLREEELTWEMLLGEAWILPERGTPMRNAVESVFRTMSSRPKSWIESSAIPTNISLLNKFDLIWVLSLDVAEYFRSLGALAILPGVELVSPGPFSLGYQKHRQLSAAAQRMRETLLEAVAQGSHR